MSKLDEVLRLLKDVKQSGSQWMARCPAHDDSNPSLAVSEGKDGRVLLYCHVGCDTKDVVRRLGLSMADLMPPNGAGTKPYKHPAGRPQPGSREAALGYLVRRFGQPSHVWDYHDRNGNVIGATVRFDTPKKKVTRPMSLTSGRWEVRGMPEPRPLYGLPAVLEASYVVVTEGEKAADAARLLGYTATTSAHGSNSPSKTDWSPLAGKDVVILPDNDEPGQGYAETVAAILARLEPSARVKIVTIPGLPEGGDVADLVRQGDETGIQDLRTQIDQLIAETPEFAGMMTPTSGNGDLRPVILLDNSDRPGIIDGTVIAISPLFFKYGNEVVRVINTPGGMSIAVATQEGIEDIANRLIRYQQPTRAKNGETGYVDSCAPPWLGKMISKKQDWPELRELRGIRRGPFLRGDGTIGGLEPGYDAASKYFVDTDEDWSALKSDPTKEDVDAAVKLLRDLVSEFPFENEVSESVWIASVLTHVARDAIRGSVPLFLFDATTPGSGKTLLAKIASRIADGGLPGITSLSQDKEEQRKAITSLLLEGSTFIVFDNVTGKIESPVLNGLVTSEVWKDRRLGSNTNVTVLNRAVIIITANHAEFDSDTARRTLRLRLAPKVDHPQDRTFQIPDILDHVRHERPQLLVAALQIIRFHVINQSSQTAAASGQDGSASCLPFGSFESWARVVQLAMTRLGLADPVLSVENVRKIDVDLVRLRDFIQAWREWDPSWGGTAQAFINTVFIDPQRTDEVLNLQQATLAFVGKSRDGIPTASDLGVALGKVSERVVDGYAITQFGRRSAGNVWGVVEYVRTTPADGV